MLVVCQAVRTDFDGLYDVRMRTDYVVDTFSEQPIGEELLLFVRQGLIFYPPMHAGDDCVRLQGFASYNCYAFLLFN